MANAGTAGRPAPPLRLTRRGWIVVATLMGMLASMIVIAVVALAAPPGEAAGKGRQTTVRQGDTLWSIAVREVPGRDPYEVIDEIRRINGIGDYTIRPGDDLRLPGRH